tara:strand:- start:8208 stop:9488 length:1281 start_codon:yes stop_codon:yes gene_type:complete
MRIFYLLLILFCAKISSAQNFNSLVNTSPDFIYEIDLTTLKENQLYISMPFAKKLVLNPEQKKQLQERVSIKLELVYTKYRTVKSFDQKNLNQNRLKELNNLVPALFENRFWGFNLISQTKGNSREECNKMFHGFIVTFRPNSSKSMLAAEANYLTDLVTSMLKNDSLETDTIPKKYDIKTHYDQAVGYIHDTLWSIETIKPPSPPDFFYLQSLYKDTTVLGAFNRNKNWTNFIVATDVTGSMSPYSAQVFVWLKQQAENKTAQYFVFFNDGDEKRSNKKKPLETKGIYITKNKNIDAVINTATKCMRSGSGGGEGLENDIEAIIDGIKHYPEADQIILVADNMEGMRDYKFINQIKKPVRVIICGAGNRINVTYMDLARQTNGSVHTKHTDVVNLKSYKNGDYFFIDEREYLFQNGTFHSIYENH